MSESIIKKQELKGITEENFIMLPIVDFVFKLLFGDIKHKERLISLLSSILRLPQETFAGIEISNTELPKLFNDDKMGILDIRAKLADGKQVNIEIQVIPSGFMPERTLFYWAKMYTSQIKEGDTFTNLKECITINIVDYAFLPVNKMHTQFHLTEDTTGHRLTEILEIHFCELKKLRSEMELNDMDDPSVDWMRFIGAKTKGEMEMLAQKNEAIKDAFNYLKIISQDEDKRLAYEARQMWLMDQRTREEIAREEGEKNAKIEMAKKLIKRGLKLDYIAEDTGFSFAEIEELARTMK